MIKYKKFYEYDMRDDFSIPVYVSDALIEVSKIKGIASNNRIAGQLTRERGETFLELATLPAKKNYVSPTDDTVMYLDDKVDNQDDGGTWYASSWDGKLHFVLHKYFRIEASSHTANNHFGGVISKWLISDYSIVGQFMLAEKVTYLKLSLDHIYAWFGIFRPEQNWEKTESLIISNLTFDNQEFSLIIGANGQAKHELHVYKQTAYMSISIDFEKAQNREFGYDLSVIIRNFFQMLIGKSVGINRIILNRDSSAVPNGQEVSPMDERENWFLDQSFLPNDVEETKNNFDIEYRTISKNFNSILSSYLLDSKLQHFVATYLLVEQFRTPVDTQIITLVSAIETYYNEAKFSNNKKIKKALEKMKKMSQLISDTSVFFKNEIRGKASDIDSLFEEMISARNYIVHGVNPEKYTSEAELVPDLIIFKSVIKTVINNIITQQVAPNN